MRNTKKKSRHSPEAVRAFFSRSDLLDRIALRPLSHIASNWELRWDGAQYEHEPNSFAEDLNILIETVISSPRPINYHDYEDIIAKMQAEHWPIQKIQGRWIGADYRGILEQGAFRDVGQQNLINALVGRVHAALDQKNQDHFDKLEEGHLVMLAELYQ